MTVPSAEEAISALGLSKRFATTPALDRVDLSIAEGQSVAVFGPNGAGKTTLLRVLTLALRPSSGQLRIAGLDPRRDAATIRSAVGMISHRSFLYDDLSARQNLEFFARLYGVERPRERADELLASVELSDRADDPVASLSRGMQQRVSLARALVHDPRVVFLDEPFTGLDPHAAGLFGGTLTRLRERGRTVLLVTHNLRQGLELCERWIVMARGRVIAGGRSADADPAGFDRHYRELVSGARQ